MEKLQRESDKFVDQTLVSAWADGTVFTLAKFDELRDHFVKRHFTPRGTRQSDLAKSVREISNFGGN
jgi:hypothetical protein